MHEIHSYSLLPQLGLVAGSYKTWTGLWNACELSFKLVEMQVKTAVV